MRRAFLRQGLLAMCVALLAGCGGPTLDRDGGYVLTYRVQPGESAEANATVEALHDRLRAAKQHTGNVRSLKNGEFAIELPGASDQDVAVVQEFVAMQGDLELRILADPKHNAGTVEEALRSSENQTDDWRWVLFDSDAADLGTEIVSRPAGSAQDILLLVGEFDVTSQDLTHVRPGRDSSLRPCIHATLTPAGSAKMRMLTGENLQRQLGIVLDGRLRTAPIIRSQIGDRFEITGDFTQQEVDAIVAVLRVGKLPARLDTANVTVKRVEPK